MATKQAYMEKSGQRETGRDTERERSSNPDAITGAPGSHPVGTGVGAATGGVAGAVAGAAIGSAVPVIGTVVGGAVGAVVGATGGGLVGKEVAEEVNPTVEEAYWRQNYSSRPYSTGISYDEFAPAYRYGWESRSQYRGRTFDDVETTLATDWDRAKAKSTLDWQKARAATRDAWNRVDRSAGDDVSTLNTLIETLEDGRYGFETAAASVQDPGLKSVFSELSQQRSQFATELQTIVRRFGAEPQKTGSAAASMHRGWMGLKSALGGGDKSILNEAERGEDSAVKSYEKAMEGSLSPEVSRAVTRQYADVKNAHDRVRNLRNGWRE